MRSSERLRRSHQAPYNMHFLPLVVFGFLILLSVSSNETDHFNLLADTIIPLENNEWRLRSNDGVFEDLIAKVPGDLLSDLMTNGMISCNAC